jgi:GxxExxY protein
MDHRVTNEPVLSVLFDNDQRSLNNLSERIIGCAIKVHRTLGPGLLESAYEVCLAHELSKRGLRIERQVGVPVVYDGLKLDAGYVLDIVVEDCVILELKAVESLLSIHEAQLLTYLKLTGIKLGLLINFNVALLKNGIKRKVM